MKKILVFSWFYPPTNSSEGMLTYKLLKNSSHEYVVFTQAKIDSWTFGIDKTIPELDNVVTVFSDVPTLNAWVKEGFQYFCAHKEEYSCIMTRSMPPESHEIGIKIKKEFPDVKWIASFGDPVKDFPYQHMAGVTYSPNSTKNLINRNQGLRFKLSPKRMLKAEYWKVKNHHQVQYQKKMAFIEDSTLNLADKIIFNNYSQMKFMGRSIDIEGKSFVLRHSFDDSIYSDILSSQPSDQAPRKVRFVFCGELNDVRTGLPLFKAIKSLSDSMPDLAERAEFILYGKVSDRDLAYILRNHLEHIIFFENPVSYKDSLQVIKDADWALHIDADISSACDENVFFAGKIVDYFGAGTPILAITMSKGDVHDELMKAGMLVLSYSPGEIKEYLYRILYCGYQVHPDWDFISQYHSKNVAQIMDREMAELMESRS